MGDCALTGDIDLGGGEFCARSGDVDLARDIDLAGEFCVLTGDTDLAGEFCTLTGSALTFDEDLAGDIVPDLVPVTLPGRFAIS